MKNRPLLSIIILNWNTKNLLKNCLESIPFKKEFEIIVIDNASSDGSQEFLKKQKDIKVIFNKKNLGFAKANNQGIKKVKGKYTLLLNSDTVVQGESLERLIKYLEDNPKVLAASPLLLNKDKTRQVQYYMRFPSPLQVLLYHNLFFRPWVMKTFLRYLVVSKTQKESPFAVEQLPGAALIARTDLFKKYSLDEDYPFLFEDVDWCYRVKKEEKGFLMVLPKAKIIHLGGASWKQWLGRDRFSFYQHYFSSLLIFVKKHFPAKIIAFRLALSFGFFTNTLVHLFLLRFKKLGVQARLFAWILFN